VGRSLLNSLPDWTLILLFLAVTGLIAFAGFWLIRRTKLSSWRDEVSTQSVVGITAIAMTFFALVLALVLVDLYANYKDASSNVTNEANTLITVVQDADAFPPANEEAVREAVQGYVAEIRQHEFPALRDGHEEHRSPAQLLRISTVLRHYNPKTEAQISFYNSAVSQANNLVVERNARVNSANSFVPAALTVLLLVLAVVSLVTALFIKTHHPGLDGVLVVSVGFIIALALVTALILQYPFSGSIAVSSDPLRDVTVFSALTHGP
jgi:cytochrome bd-type quinol oxidase subunit 2